MAHTAVVLGADTFFGRTLCETLLDRDILVFGDSPFLAEEHPGRFQAVPLDPLSAPSLETAARTVGAAVEYVDLLVCHADFPATDTFAAGWDFAAMQRTYDANAIGPLRFVEAFYPLTRGGQKRLCFTSDTRGSIARTTGSDDAGYAMAKTALHMAVTILFNDLRREGYTFRLFVPGVDPTASARFTADYFLQDRDDEFRLTITDDRGTQWPF